MRLIKISKRYYPFPEHWNELSGAQVIKVLQTFDKDDWSPEQKFLQHIRILSGISKFRFLLADPSELQEYFYLLEFLLNENTLTKNVLPIVCGHYGPADGIDNLLVKEYIYTEAHYVQYKEGGKNLSDLNNMVAILYRRGKKNYDHSINPDGDSRQQFNANLIGLHGAIISKWPLEIKLAILHFYEGCREQLIKTYKEDVFDGGPGEPAKRGMLSVAISMADEGIFGTLQQVEELNIHTFLIGISESMEKIKRLKTPPTPAI